MKPVFLWCPPSPDAIEWRQWADDVIYIEATGNTHHLSFLGETSC